MSTERGLPTAADVVVWMERTIAGELDGAAWATETMPLAPLIVSLAQSNLRQWDLEDATRVPGASDSAIASAKREIDRLNTDRHLLVQDIDVAVDRLLDQPETALLATESPGMVIDRLSVMVIRRCRTAVVAAQNPALADRIPALDAQIAALSDAFETYLDELDAGTRRFLCYESFKLYRPSSPVVISAKE